MLTWYSETRPSVHRTCCSLIQAPRTLRSVLAARASPCWIASSKLFDEVALISETLATDIHALLPQVAACCDGRDESVCDENKPGHGCAIATPRHISLS